MTDTTTANDTMIAIIEYLDGEGPTEANDLVDAIIKARPENETAIFAALDTLINVGTVTLVRDLDPAIARLASPTAAEDARSWLAGDYDSDAPLEPGREVPDQLGG